MYEATLDATGLDEVHSALGKARDVSDYLDFPFTLNEVVNYFVPRRKISAEQLRQLLEQGVFSDLRFEIKNGYLMTKPSQTVEARSIRERMSGAKLKSAAEFSKSLKRLVPFIRTVAVSGSTAYGSAEEWDDIDLFIITERRRLWLSLFMALIFVRVNKLLRLRPPHLLDFCLSYAHDEEGFEREAARRQANPFFARELLRATPLIGTRTYRELLRKNAWVGDIYSARYASKLSELREFQDEGRLRGRGSLAGIGDLVESIAFVVLSSYLRMRAFIANLKFKSKGQTLRVFEPLVTQNSCIYSSTFYRWLQDLWAGL